MDSNVEEKEVLDEGIKEEVEKMNDSEDNLSESNENLKVEIEHLKDKLEKVTDENLKLRDEVKRLENELHLHKESTSNDELIMLKKDLRRALEAEENSKKAMNEFALVIREVASEANQAKEKLLPAEQQIRILKNKAQNSQTALDEANKEKEKLQNTIDQLRAEAEESLLAWNEKEMEFVKCLKEEEDDKAKLQQELNDLEKESAKIKEETAKIKEQFKESFEEAEMAKAQSLELKDCLEENQRKLTLFTQENVRLRRENENIPSSSSQELILDDVDHDRLAPSTSKKDKKSHQVEEDQKKSSKKESKSHSHSHSHGGEDKRLHKKEAKIKKEHKMSHVGEDKEMKKTKKDSSLDKELKVGHTHAKSYAIICFDPMAMLPIPGISYNKHKESGGDATDKDDKLTDSIFDIVDSPPKPHRHRHRRTTSVDDDKSISSEEFEHEELSPHLDDMEVERAGAHATKKGVLLRKFGDLWKRKNQGHHSAQNHHNAQNHNLHQKDETT